VNRNWFKYVLILISAVILQLSVSNYIQILHWKPDFILIAVVLIGIRFNAAIGSTAGFFGGLAGDLVSAHLLGLGALSKSVAGYVAGNISPKFEQKSQFVLTLLISGLIDDALFFVINTMGKNFSWHIIFFVYIIPSLFYTVLVGMFLYYLLGNWLMNDE